MEKAHPLIYFCWSQGYRCLFFFVRKKKLSSECQTTAYNGVNLVFLYKTLKNLRLIFLSLKQKVSFALPTVIFHINFNERELCNNLINV